MQNSQVIRAKRYLFRFDQILNEMADKMLSQEVTSSITINFIKCMVPHHQAAIYMSRYQPLQEIAKNIIRVQTDGIEQMNEIARTTTNLYNQERDVNTYMAKYLEITKNMIERMKNSPRCININLNFVGEMIPHHEGAIAMCENLLQYRIDPRLRNVADAIIKEQSEGVEKLKEIQKRLCRR